jgi:hypothetical protein
MSSKLHFNPHVRALWCNKVDVNLQDSGQHIGSFTTYGKVMAFVMRFFGVALEKIELNGRIHFVRPKELERFKQILTQDKTAMVPIFDQMIKQAKAAAEITNQTSNPSSGNHKIKLYSFNPDKMVVDHDTLNQQVLGDEFLFTSDIGARSDLRGVYFLPFTTRPMPEEIEKCLRKVGLGDIPAAVVITQLWKDFTKAARPMNIHSGLELEKNNHRVYHVLVHQDGLNDCRWNDAEVANIRTFLRDPLKATA